MRFAKNLPKSRCFRKFARSARVRTTDETQSRKKGGPSVASDGSGGGGGGAFLWGTKGFQHGAWRSIV